MDQQLIPRHTLDTLIDGYQRAMDMMREGHNKVAEAEALLVSLFGEKSMYMTYGLISRYENWNYIEPHKYSEDIQKTVRTNIWRYIFSRIGIINLLSEDRVKVLEDKLKYNNMPEITAEEVIAMLSDFSASAGSLINEVIKETYRYLRPPLWNKLKTNKRYEIGPKVIKQNVIEHYTRKECVSEYHSGALARLDRTMHLLDGKPISVTAHISPLVDEINTGNGSGETEYFAFKTYMNGNLHLTFKRLDLLAELNQRCGGLMLKGEV